MALRLRRKRGQLRSYRPTHSTGTIVSGSEQRYCGAPLWGYPYPLRGLRGETRFTSGTVNTDKLFTRWVDWRSRVETSQRDVGFGIYHYGARFRAAPPDTCTWRDCLSNSGR